MRKAIKRTAYYALPFIVVPLLMLFCEVLDNTELLTMSPYIMGASLVLASAAFGFLSPSDRIVDCLISLIMPLSLFCFMFVAGFFSKSDLETRFHLSEAVDVALQPIALLLYVAMAMITLVASLKLIRRRKKHAVS